MSQLYLPAFFVHTISAILVPYLQIIIRNHGYSHASIGVLLGLFEAVGIISPFILADWADRTGKPRMVLLIITLGTFAFTIPLTLFGSPIATVVSIILLAFFFKPVWPIQDAMFMHRIGSDLWQYTKLRSSGTLGFISFSLFFQFSGVLRVTDNRSMLLWTGVSTCLYLGSLAVLKPDEAIAKHERRKITWNFWSSKGRQAVFSRKLIIGISVIAMNRLAMAAITNFFPLYVTEELHRGELVSILMAFAAITELGFMLLGGRLLRSGVRPIILIGISSLGLCFRLLSYMLIPTLAGAVVGQLFHSVVYGFFHPAAIMFVNNNIAPERRALGMALYTSMGIGLPTVVGAGIGGYVVEWIGFGRMFGSYTVFAILSLVMIFLFRKVLLKRAIALPGA